MHDVTEEKRGAGKGREKSGAGALRRAAVFGTRYLLGFLLSECVFFGEYAPFGLAFAASTAGGLAGIPGLIGAAAGYGILLLRIGGTKGIRYLAACFLIGVLSPLFRRFLDPEKGLYAPLLTLLSLCAASIPSLREEAGDPVAWVLFASELMLAVFASMLFRPAFRGGDGVSRSAQNGARMLLLMLAAAAFSPTAVYGVSVGRSLLVFLCLSRIESEPFLRTGTAAGVAAGAISDASFGFTPFYSLVMALAGTFAALFRRFGKFFSALGFVTAAAAATVWARAAGGEFYGLPSLLEYAAGAALFLAFPEKARLALERWDPLSGKTARAEKKEDPHAVWIREEIADALYRAAEAYGEAAAETRGARRLFREELIVPAVREEACASCERRSECTSSHAAEKEFTRLKKVLEEKPEAVEADLSPGFSAFCPSPAVFSREISRLWYAGRVQKSYNARINESVALLAGEYGELAALLGKLSQNARDGTAFDLRAEEALEEALAEYGIKAGVIAVSDARGRMTLRIAGEDLGELSRRKEHFEEVLSKAAGRRFVLAESRGGERRAVFTAREKPVYSFAVEALSQKRRGSGANGDYGSWFLHDDRLYLLLSDGMGSGGEAERESARFGGMTERLIRGGLPPEEAVGAAMRSRLLSGGMVAATADLLEADLMNRSLVFYKCGAAPSYIKGRDGVRKIAGGGYFGERIRTVRTSLEDGETVLMVTDGLSDGLSDGDFIRRAEEAAADDVETLCETLLKGAGGEKDDRSVAALQLFRADPPLTKRGRDGTLGSEKQKRRI